MDACNSANLLNFLKMKSTELLFSAMIVNGLVVGDATNVSRDFYRIL